MPVTQSILWQVPRLPVGFGERIGAAYSNVPERAVIKSKQLFAFIGDLFLELNQVPMPLHSGQTVDQQTLKKLNVIGHVSTP